MSEPGLPTRSLPSTGSVVTTAVPRIDGYQIIDRLGEGGMGLVWRALQLSTKREVALKVIGAGAIGSRRAQLRFEREVELTARLEHPHIARVYDSGVHQGVYFYAAELVADGVPLDEYARRAGLGPRQVIELMSTVCQAVAHAHENGVIHRDLKPANVLVDGAGRVKVVDFGLAKLLADSNPELTISADGEFAGTPAYMSPEQARGGATRLDTRSDVYSLGVILHRLLTGRTPHDPSGSRLELLRRISEKDVTLDRSAGLGGELGAVLLKALARERERRYATAAELADDLGRLLSGEPVSARPPTLTYIARKRLRRHWPQFVFAALVGVLVCRLPIASAIAVALLLMGGAVASYLRVAALRTLAERERDTARLEARRSKVLLARALLGEGKGLMALYRFREAGPRLDESVRLLRQLGEDTFVADLDLWCTHHCSPPPLRELRGHAGPVRAVAFLPESRRLLSGGADGSVCLWDYRDGRLLSVVPDVGAVSRLALAPDGRTVACLAEGRPLTLIDLAAADRPRREIRVYSGRPLAVAFSPDGNQLLVGTTDTKENACVIDARTGRRVRNLVGHDGAVRAVAFSPDGLTAFTGDGDGARAAVPLAGRGARLCGWRVADGERLWSATPPNPFDSVNGLAVTPDGRRILVNLPNSAWVVDAADGSTVPTRWYFGSCAGVLAMAVSPSGAQFCAAIEDGSVHLRILSADVTQVACVAGHDRAARAVAFSPDGRFVASGGDDAVVRLWSAYADRDNGLDLPLRLIPAEDATHFDPAYADCDQFLKFSDDGRLAYGEWGPGADGGGRSIRVWDAATGREVGSILTPQDADGFGGGGGRRLWVCERDGDRERVGVWDLESIQRVATLDLSTHGSFAGAVTSPDGEVALADFAVPAGGGATVERTGLFETRSGRPICWLDVPGRGQSSVTGRPGGRKHPRAQLTAFSADGTVVALAANGTVSVWEAPSGRTRFTAAVPGGAACVAISPEGLALAVGLEDGSGVELFDLGSGGRSAALAGMFGPARSVSFTPDGRYVTASGDKLGLTWFWDTATGELVASLQDWGGGGQFAPDGPGQRRVLVSKSDPARYEIVDFSAAERFRAFSDALPEATRRLQHDADDPVSLRVLGRWYAFRGEVDWACELLERARAGGAHVPALEMARCHWRNGNADAARRYFEGAMNASVEAAERHFLRLCLRAVEDAARQGTLVPERKGADLFYNTASKCVSEGKTEAALKMLDLAVASDPARGERGRAAKRIIGHLRSDRDAAPNGPRCRLRNPFP